MYKIGDKVKVSHNGGNASDLNVGGVHHPCGVYSILEWDAYIFTIASERIRIHHFKTPTYAYLLTLDGKEIGHVYEDSLTLIKPLSNVRITITNTDNGCTDLIQRNDLYEDELNQLWNKHMVGFVGASTSKLNYEKSATLQYTCQTGVLKNTNILVSWVSWYNL